MAQISDVKAQVRKAALAARARDHGQGFDAAANARLLAWLGEGSGGVIAGYMPIRTELSPLAAMTALAAHNTLCVPVVRGAGQPLAFHVWTPGAAMVAGAFGAQVPADVIPAIPDTVIVPMVAFDARCARLGYGGGFYDRTLQGLRARAPALRVVGFAHDAQEVAEVPLEPTDQPLDAVITPTRLLTP